MGSVLLLGAALLAGPRERAASDPAPDAPALAPVLTFQTRRQAYVGCLILSPDKRLLASVSDDGRFILSDAGAGLELRRGPATQRGAGSAAFSPDSRHLLVLTSATQVDLIDCATGKTLVTCVLDAAKHGTARCVGFTPSGTTLLVGTDAGLVLLYDRDANRAPRSKEAHKGGVTALACVQGGSSWYSAGADGTLHAWGAGGTKRAIHEAGSAQKLTALALSPRGDLLAAGTDTGTTLLWKGENPRSAPRELASARPGAVASMGFSPDGTLLVVGHHTSNLLEVWDTATHNQMASFTPAGYTPLATNLNFPCVAFGPDPQTLLFPTSGGSLGRISVATREFGVPFPDLAEPVRRGAWSPDGRWMGLPGDSSRRLKIFDGASGQLLDVLAANAADGAALHYFAFAPDGTHVLTGEFGGRARIREIITGAEVVSFTSDAEDFRVVAFTPDGYGVVSGSMDGKVRVWNARTGTVTRTFTGHEGEIKDLSISRRGDRLLSVGFDKTARVWDLNRGTPVCVIESAELGHRGLLLPDGSHVVSRDKEKVLGVWNATTGKLVRRIPEDPTAATASMHTQPITSLAISPDGTTLVTAALDLSLRVWNFKTGRQEHVLTGHVGWASWVELSADGKRIISGGQDSTARVWETATGKALCEIAPSFNEPRTWCVFDAQGRWYSPNPRNVSDVHWVLGPRALALDQVGAELFHPGLLSECMGLAAPTQLPPADPRLRPQPPPSVHLSLPVPGKLVVRVELADQGGGIGKVGILLNGKRVRDNARAGTVESRRLTDDFTVDLTNDPQVLPGCPNCIEAVVEDAQGTSRTRGAELEVQDPRPVLGPPELWVLACGVSDYAGKGVDLAFPCKDARDIAAALQLAGNAKFTPACTHVLLLTAPAPGDKPRADGEKPATLPEMRAALKALDACKANDVVVIYLAGHGIVGPGRTGEYHYLLSEADTLAFGPTGAAPAGALTGTELAQALQVLAAVRSQVVILDTCAANALGGALGGPATAGGSRSAEPALGPLSSVAGACLLAGCAASESSLESRLLRNGLLTYAILQGLRCGCPFKPNGEVSVDEMFVYARNEVIKWTDRLRMRPQVPIMHMPTAPFAIGSLTPEDRMKIVLEDPKPIFVNTTFLRNKSPDSLGLSELIDGLLESGAPAGGAPFAIHPVVHLDTARQADAYLLDGRYETRGSLLGAEATLYRIKYPVEDVVATFRVEVATANPDHKRALAEQIVRRALEELHKVLPSPPR